MVDSVGRKPVVAESLSGTIWLALAAISVLSIVVPAVIVSSMVSSANQEFTYGEPTPTSSGVEVLSESHHLSEDLSGSAQEDQPAQKASAVTSLPSEQPNLSENKPDESQDAKRPETQLSRQNSDPDSGDHGEIDLFEGVGDKDGVISEVDTSPLPVHPENKVVEVPPVDQSLAAKQEAEEAARLAAIQEDIDAIQSLNRFLRKDQIEQATVLLRADESGLSDAERDLREIYERFANDESSNDDEIDVRLRQIRALERKLRYEESIQERIAKYLEIAKKNESEENGRRALSALAELLKLDPKNEEAIRLQSKIESYFVGVDSQEAKGSAGGGDKKLTEILASLELKRHPNLQIRSIETGGLIYTNRNYTFSGISENLKGLPFIAVPGKHRVDLEYRVATDGYVLIFSDGDKSRLTIPDDIKEEMSRLEDEYIDTPWKTKFKIYSLPVKEGQVLKMVTMNGAATDIHVIGSKVDYID